MTIIEELPNSVEELVLCGEMDYDYIVDHFPNVSINIKDVIDVFAQSGVASMETFLCSDEDEVLRKGQKMSQTNHQKIRNIYAIRSLKELNKMSVLLGFTPLNQEQFDALFEREYAQHFGSKSVKEIYEKYRPQHSFNRARDRRIY